MLFAIKNLYNFSTYSPTSLGAAFRRCKVVGILDYDTALKYSNVDMLQRQVYPDLPTGTPDKLTRYTYILFAKEDGTKFVLAYPWIIENSIVEVHAVNLSVTIYNTDDSDVAKIRDSLNIMGYNFEIAMLDV